MKIDNYFYDVLFSSGNWMIRMSDDGKAAYNGFQWAPLGEWTEAPDWNDQPNCGGGLHGQSPKGYGLCIPGTRIDLCETEGVQVVIDGDKVKVRRAKIVATDLDIPPEFFEYAGLDLSKWPGESLGKLTTIGRNADFRNSKIKTLGKLTTIGGNAYFGDSEVKSLGKLTTIGRNAYFRNSKIKTLGKLTTIGGNADFWGSEVKSLDKLTTIGGFADFGHSKVKSLGKLTTIGGFAYFRDSEVKFSLPKNLTIKGKI